MKNQTRRHEVLKAEAVSTATRPLIAILSGVLLRFGIIEMASGLALKE